MHPGLGSRLGDAHYEMEGGCREHGELAGQHGVERTRFRDIDLQRLDGVPAFESIELRLRASDQGCLAVARFGQHVGDCRTDLACAYNNDLFHDHVTLDSSFVAGSMSAPRRKAVSILPKRRPISTALCLPCRATKRAPRLPSWPASSAFPGSQCKPHRALGTAWSDRGLQRQAVAGLRREPRLRPHLHHCFFQGNGGGIGSSKVHPERCTLHSVSKKFDMIVLVEAQLVRYIDAFIDCIGVLEGIECALSSIILSMRIDH